MLELQKMFDKHEGRDESAIRRAQKDQHNSQKYMDIWWNCISVYISITALQWLLPFSSGQF